MRSLKTKAHPRSPFEIPNLKARLTKTPLAVRAIHRTLTLITETAPVFKQAASDDIEANACRKMLWGLHTWDDPKSVSDEHDAYFEGYLDAVKSTLLHYDGPDGNFEPVVCYSNYIKLVFTHIQ